MKKRNPSFVRAGCAILVSLAITQNQTALGGWSALVNGKSIGWAAVNVTSSILQTNNLTTVNNMSLPSAAMAPVVGYKTNSALPEGAAATTYARVKTFAGGVVQGVAVPTVGDGADHRELQERVFVNPADCAAITVESKIDQSDAQFAANGNSGTISVNATATAGTALWLRGFEFTGSMADVPTDDPNTVKNEGIEYLKQHGVQKFETLLLGPFEFGGSNNVCPLIVPFTLNSSNLEHLVYSSDAVALSLPLIIICPSNIVVKCEDSFTYGVVKYGGCGDINITYSIPPLAGPFPARYFPVGVTPVTVTATDTNGHSTNCTFTVTVTDTIPPVTPTLASLTFGTCSGTPAIPPTPTTTDNCKGVVSGTTTTPFPITALGTTVVTWTFNDGNGNSTAATQAVTVAGLTFQGFYSPVGTANNAVTNPVTRTAGASFPLKWDMFCGATRITGGTPPTVDIQKVLTKSPLTLGDATALTADYQNDWHINWPTPNATKKDIYKATVNLPDGSKAVLFVEFK